jgi:hypothetical protein
MFVAIEIVKGRHYASSYWQAPTRVSSSISGMLTAMRDMTPSVVECDVCGRLSPVEGWEPVYEDPSPLDTVYTPPRVKEFKCEIRCNKCGIRVQVMPPPKT